MVDVDRLPLTQYLVLDVLAARFRLGERWWPFPTRAGMALRALEQAGLVDLMPGEENTVRAGLTEQGKAGVLDTRYGAANKVEQMRSALKLIAEFAGGQASLVPGMRSVAEIARRALDGER